MSVLAQIGATDWARGFKPRSCAGDSCGRWLTERQLKVHPVGVTLEDRWYCSYGCALQSLCTALRKLAAPLRQAARAQTRKSLALHLLQRGLLNEEQYKKAMKTQRVTEKEMGDVLIDLGFLREEWVAEARAALWSCPVMNWDGRLPIPTLHLPGSLSRRYGMMPVHLSAPANRLFLGFRHDVEYVPLFAIEQITGYKVEPCILSSSTYAVLAETPRNDTRYEEQVFGYTANIAEMARKLCDAGRETNALNIAVTRCGDYLWGRLIGGSRTVDALFEVC